MPRKKKQTHRNIETQSPLAGDQTHQQGSDAVVRGSDFRTSKADMEDPGREAAMQGVERWEETEEKIEKPLEKGIDRAVREQLQDVGSAAGSEEKAAEEDVTGYRAWGGAIGALLALGAGLGAAVLWQTSRRRSFLEELRDLWRN